jgi:two-component system chemotaxis response regulator CheB
MTGMGSDGARGLLALRQAGARTFAQDEESCVVFGMPQAAIKMGAVDRVASLQALPQMLIQAIAEPIAP